METNTLIIISGYDSIAPKLSRKAYLNIGEEQARQRFLQHHPNARDITARVVGFKDEVTLRADGTITAD